MATATNLTDTMKDTLTKLARDGYAFAGWSTWRALERRGLVTENTAPRDMTKGTRCFYMLTSAGRAEVVDVPQEAACGNRWRYGKDTCARMVGHIGPHRNTEALEAWSFQWFDNEGTPAEETKPAEIVEDKPAKVYERTENGVTTIVSVKDGVDEAERAYADRRNVPSMSSHRGRHHLEYRDGRIVDLVLVDAPAEEPKEAPAVEGRTFTVIYTGAGEPIVHAAGCSHNIRDSLQGAHTTETVKGTLEDVAALVFADFLEEDTTMTPADYVADLAVKPCAR